MRHRRSIWLWMLLVATATTAPGWAARTNTISGNWSNPSIWSGSQVPQAGEDVVVSIGTTVTNDTVTGTPALASFTNNGTLVFNGWTNALTASNVVINGTISHLPNTAITTNAFGVWVPDNRIYIVCTNLIVTTSGVINADTKGYGCRNASPYKGYGPGASRPAGANDYAYDGAGYGGRGGQGAGIPGQPYGSTNAPTDPGSGSCGGAAGTGGSGGGAVRIDASGVVTVNGKISANGESPTAGGSGGGIYITCNTFNGTNGVISAAGGGGGAASGGTGGGGRIAVVYNQAAQGLLAPPAVTFTTGTGNQTANQYNNLGDMGTLYFPDRSLLNQNLFTQSGELWIPGFTNLSVTSVAFSNCALRFPLDRFALTVTNNLTVTGTNVNYLKVQFSNAVVICGGNLLVNNMPLFIYCGASSGPIVSCGSLTVTNGGILHVFGGATNSTWKPYGAQFSVGGAVLIATNSWIYPYSHPTNGGSPYFVVGRLNIDAGGGIDASKKGYASGNGPGVGNGYYGGGSYGGKGGGGSLSGNTYGSSNAPVDPGSGATPGCPLAPGGGLVWLKTGGSITLNGTITAKGSSLADGNYGGGSGGGIYLICRGFSGTGVLRASGGDNSTYGGTYGGGGGRIAVWRCSDTSNLSETNVNGGVHATIPANNGFPGTLVWGQLPIPGTVFFGR